jgi:hypothetical protein
MNFAPSQPVTFRAVAADKASAPAFSRRAKPGSCLDTTAAGGSTQVEEREAA